MIYGLKRVMLKLGPKYDTGFWVQVWKRLENLIFWSEIPKLQGFIPLPLACCLCQGVPQIKGTICWDVMLKILITRSWLIIRKRNIKRLLGTQLPKKSNWKYYITLLQVREHTARFGRAQTVYISFYLHKYVQPIIPIPVARDTFITYMTDNSYW